MKSNYGNDPHDWDIDAGISYKASTNAIQRLLNKLKPPMTRQQLILKAGSRSSPHGIEDYKKLSSLLDEILMGPDPRPRNPLGEFSPQGEGGPDPNSMAIVYKQPPQQKEKGGGVLTGSALSVLGGFGGAAGANAYRNVMEKLKEHGKKIVKRVK